MILNIAFELRCACLVVLAILAPATLCRRTRSKVAISASQLTLLLLAVTLQPGALIGLVALPLIPAIARTVNA